MAEQAGEKTLDPTPHRRQQARQQGHVAKSHDLCSAGTLLLGLAVLMMLGSGLVSFLSEYCRTQLGGKAWLSADADFIVHHAVATLASLGQHLLPILGLLCLAGIAVHIVQIGFLFLPEKLAFDPERIDPLQGLHRIVSPANAIRLAFAIIKTLLVLAVSATVIYGQREAVAGLANLPVPQLATQVSEILFWTTTKIGVALLVLGLLDYAYQWWKHEQDLKMTPQELREELQNLEGNPQVIARRKQTQRELGKTRQATAAPPPDVVLTGPDGLAVAIRYDPDTMSAPTVSSKGLGAAGKQIRDVAGQHRVTILENGELAQAIYRGVAVNQAIAGEHYTVVAALLMDVYQRDA